MISLPQAIRIGDRWIGVGHPALIVAEMSGNHGGSLQRALQIVRAAKTAGADAIKLQTYTADTITLNCSVEDFQVPTDNPWNKHSMLWDLYDSAHTPWAWHPIIFEEARRLGLEIFSSPFDETAVEFLEQLKTPAYKIASPEITHIPLLQKVAKTGKPVILSTGLAELADLTLAMDVLRSAGAKEIVILKCTTAYPAPIDESNLVTIPDMAERFGVPVGLSDHTIGSVVAIAAVALGAKIIEKHFTLDDAVVTVDSFFSAGEAEFAKMVSDIRLLEKALGIVSYDIAPSAHGSLRGRRSLYVCTEIKGGDPITEFNIQSVRPGYGMHPKYYQDVLGRRARRNLNPGDRLQWSDLE
jgi:pseudaminic acid synthase